MGFTILSRWRNPPPEGYDLLIDQIKRRHGGTPKGPWFMIARSYRSRDFPQRSINTASTRDTCFVLMEDPRAPSYVAEKSKRALNLPPSQSGTSPADNPPHYRITYIALSPIPTFDLLLHHLGDHWTHAKHAHATVQIEGQVFGIGTDLIVRVGVVKQASAPKGLVIEAELVPMPVSTGATPKMLSELLSALVPTPNPELQVVSLTEPQWNEVLLQAEDEDPVIQAEDDVSENDLDNIFCFRGSEGKGAPSDWTGQAREKRSAYIILRLLLSEGLLK